VTQTGGKSIGTKHDAVRTTKKTTDSTPDISASQELLKKSVSENGPAIQKPKRKTNPRYYNATKVILTLQIQVATALARCSGKHVHEPQTDKMFSHVVAVDMF